MMQWFRRKARGNGVEYAANEAVRVARGGGRVTGVTLAAGETLSWLAPWSMRPVRGPPGQPASPVS